MVLMARECVISDLKNESFGFVMEGTPQCEALFVLL